MDSTPGRVSYLTDCYRPLCLEMGGMVRVMTSTLHDIIPPSTEPLGKTLLESLALIHHHQ